MRKDKTADLQEAFINLAKSVEADPPPELLAAERSRDATGNFGEVRPRKFEGECFASVHYHLQVQANPKKIVQKKTMLFFVMQKEK